MCVALVVTPSNVRMMRVKISALRRVPRLFRLAWEANRRLCIISPLLRIPMAIFPVVALLVSKRIINDVVNTVRGIPHPRNDVWAMLIVSFVISYASDLFTKLTALNDSLLADEFSHHIDLLLVRKCGELDQSWFDNPEFYDKVERARQQTRTRISLVTGVFTMLRQLVTLGTLVLAISVTAPWLLALLCISLVPVFVGETKFALLNYSLLYRQTPARRELDYLRFIGTSRQTAKEVAIFSLSEYLQQRIRSVFRSCYTENRKMAQRRTWHGLLVDIIPTLAYFGAYAWVLGRALVGAISIGGMTFIVGAFSRCRDVMAAIVGQCANMAEQVLYLDDLFEFLDTKPNITQGSRTVGVVKRGIEFRNVTFEYPGGKGPTICGVSFAIGTGERVALVGENGAGKTTIAKLLARLYDPTEGQVVLDGVDIREFSLSDYHRKVAAIFQDFVRYEMTVAENIGFGRVDAMDDRKAMQGAAEMGAAHKMICELPNGYGQMLGRRFAGGIDLSLGQWQKIALSRAYFREASIFILDEPTASLDARAEAEMYERFLALSRGKMALLISHRFSTTRNADRILVLDKGRAIECGSHDELVRLGGHYAKLFEFQAAGYLGRRVQA